MALQLNTFYAIQSVSSGKYVNLAGTHTGNNVSNGNVVNLYATANGDDQKWAVEIYSNGAYVYSKRNTGYVLNKKGSNSQCHVWNKSTCTPADSKVDFLTIDASQNLYRIKLMEHNLFLTAEGSDLYWRAQNNAGSQQFKLVNGGGSSGSNPSRTTIDIPQDRICNWNQFYSVITNAINSTKGCTIVCGLDVANIYGPSAYTIHYLASYWNPQYGYVGWPLPASCSATFNGFSHSRSNGYTDSQRFTVIRSEINNNRPIIIQLYSSSDDKQHTVVAYKYTGAGDSTSTIWVLDPARTDKDTTMGAGRNVTLADAINWNHKTGMNALQTVNGNR